MKMLNQQYKAEKERKTHFVFSSPDITTYPKIHQGTACFKKRFTLLATRGPWTILSKRLPKQIQHDTCPT
jgi:hypothetical protein